MEFQLPEVSREVLDRLPSPAMLIFRERLEFNIDRMIEMAGSVHRLRPHCKTHKMADVVRLLLQKGIQRHKAATVAEAEMLADAGVRDILLAYNIVGPNIARVAELARKYPSVRFAVTADHPAPIAELAAQAESTDVRIGVFLDINTGQNRTGVAPDCSQALSLYEQIARQRNLDAAGFHVYDGHQRQQPLEERRAAVHSVWERVLALRDACQQAGLEVPVMVCGGTPTFPVYAEMTEPTIQLSPGTCVFHDCGYGRQFTDLPFQPAAAMLTRVISRPATDRATVDLGTKAIASDPPRGQRVYFPEYPQAVQEIHNEEHLALLDDSFESLVPGDPLLAVPVHVCPTSALYDRVFILESGQLAAEWPVTGRNRSISI